MATPADRRSPALKRFGLVALFAPLFAILLASLWFAARGFYAAAGPPMPADGYIAMTLGVGFSLVVGFGLMALVFYSSRHGYDDLAGSQPAAKDDGRADIDGS